MTVIFNVIWQFGIRIPRNGIQSRSCIVIYAGQGVLHVPTCSCLAHVMACSLFGAKPLPEPIPTYCQFRPCEIIQLWIKLRNFLWRKCIWKCHLWHHGHFVYMLQCVNATISYCGSVHNQFVHRVANCAETKNLKSLYKWYFLPENDFIHLIHPQKVIQWTFVQY